MEKELPYKPSMWRALVGLFIFLAICKYDYGWTISKEWAALLVPVLSYFWAYQPVFISVYKRNGKWTISKCKGWD